MREASAAPPIAWREEIENGLSIQFKWTEIADILEAARAAQLSDRTIAKLKRLNRFARLKTAYNQPETTVTAR